jgi:tripartite-type tricarboxylate transporter receptor subunit TctC
VACMRSIVTRLLAATIAVSGSFPEATLAQTYPTKPVKIVVGGTPGGGADGVARLVGQRLAELWGQAVVIEDRPGAGGTIGAEFVARAPADGYTLLLANQGTLTLAASLQKDLPYDPIRDFAPVGRIVHAPYFVVVNPAMPTRTFRELVDYALAHPGKATFAVTGEGTVGRLVLELIKSSEGVDILAVPYKGMSTAISDLLAGRIDIMFLDSMQAQPHVQAGTMRFIAAAGRNRARVAPEVPTIAEQATPGFAVEPWFALVAPARTPPDILAKLSSGLSQIVQMPDVRQHFEQQGYEVIEDTPAQFGAVIRAEIESYSATAKRAGIRGGP